MDARAPAYPNPDYGPLTPVLHYAHTVIVRADIRCGTVPKHAMLRACHEQSALYQRMQFEFNRHLRQPHTGLLGTPCMIDGMRITAFRKLSICARQAQARVLIDKTSLSAEDRQDWADNPNGFSRMSEYLAFASLVYDERSRQRTPCNLEAIIAETHARMARRAARCAANRRNQRYLPRP